MRCIVLVVAIVGGLLAFGPTDDPNKVASFKIRWMRRPGGVELLLDLELAPRSAVPREAWHADAPTRLADLEPLEPAAEEPPRARRAVRLSRMSP
jgi:hypothetical protein